MTPQGSEPAIKTTLLIERRVERSRMHQDMILHRVGRLSDKEEREVRNSDRCGDGLNPEVTQRLP